MSPVALNPFKQEVNDNEGKVGLEFCSGIFFS
jgi:hypothetical protein